MKHIATLLVLYIAVGGLHPASGQPMTMATTGHDSRREWLTRPSLDKRSATALFRADAGDVVHVANGVYLLTTNITISTDITLRGQDRTNTIIQGQYPAITNRGVYISSAGATVEEFTVTGFGIPLIITGVSGVTAAGCILLMARCRHASSAIMLGLIWGAASIGRQVVSNCVIRFNTCRAMTAGRSGGAGGGPCLGAGVELPHCR